MMNTKRLFYGVVLIMLLILAAPTSAQNLQPNYAVVAWSPNGAFIAEGGQNGLLRLTETATGNISSFYGSTGTVNSIDWSPDSTKIVTGDDDPEVKVWNVNARQLLTTLQGHEALVYSVAWSPDGARIASISLDDTIHVWNVFRYELSMIFGAGYAGSAAWNPSSNRLAFVHYGLGTSVIDPSLSISPYDLDDYGVGPYGGTSAVAWSPEGIYLAIGEGVTRNISIWRIRTNEQLVTLSGHTDEITSLTWSWANNRIASTSRDGTIRIWNPDTGQQTQIIQVAHPIYSVDFSPDGTQFVYNGSRGIVIVNVDDGVATP